MVIEVLAPQAAEGNDRVCNMTIGLQYGGFDKLNHREINSTTVCGLIADFFYGFAFYNIKRQGNIFFGFFAFYHIY